MSAIRLIWLDCLHEIFVKDSLVYSPNSKSSELHQQKPKSNLFTSILYKSNRFQTDFYIFYDL